MKSLLSATFVILVLVLICTGKLTFAADHGTQGETGTGTPAAQETTENEGQPDINTLTEDRIKALLGDKGAGQEGNCQSSACQEGSGSADSQEYRSQSHMRED